jgi:hypothetical protein
MFLRVWRCSAALYLVAVFTLSFSVAYAQDSPSHGEQTSSQQKAEPYKVNCENPEGHDAADLCEQRRMAKAAEDAVWWARLQAWLGGLGFVAIFITLIFTARASAAASQQVRLSRHALVDTDRAFVFPDLLIFSAITDVKTKLVQHWTISMRWKNSGKTPTRNLRTFVNKQVRTEILPADFDFPDLGRESIPSLVAPGDTLESTPLVTTLDELERVADGRSHFYFYGWAEYDDVFERTLRHRTEFCYKVTVGGNPRAPGHFSTRWNLYGKYNGADEECDGPLRTQSPRAMNKRGSGTRKR